MMQRAAEFVWKNARLLDRALFALVFEGGPAGAVVGALKAYQNEDGGFGNALEPDMRGPDSQPAAVEMALHYLLAAGGNSHMVAQVLNFLQGIATKDGGVPKALPSVMRYPRAWWWEAAENPPADINPTAGLVGLLYGLGAAGHSWLEQATAYCWKVVESAQFTRPHDFLSVMRFLEHVPDRDRAEAGFRRMAGQMEASGVIALDPRAPGYAKMPLDWAPSPSTLCRRLFSDEIIALHLDALAARQADDGGWPLNWTPISPANEYEQRGRITVEALKTLRAYGWRGLR